MTIAARNIVKRLGGLEVLRGLNLSVPAGSAYAFIGANGAGKTTAIKIFMNLITADGGEAFVLGVESRKLSPRELARIGYVSENQVMPAGMTAASYLDYLRPLYASWDAALETELLASFTLPGERRIGDLSHGMRIKLALTAALAFRPALLVLDEPFSGVDAAVRDELLAGLLRQAGDTTIFVSSHELAEIESLVSHVGYLENGMLLFEDTVDSMNARFRGVRVVLEGAAEVPPDAPASWRDLAATGNVFSFVDSGFCEAELNGRLAALPGTIRRVEIEPVALRRVFTALARTARNNG